MKFKAPLTREELKVIQDRYRNTGGDSARHDLRTLLMEVGCLRALLLRADQMQRPKGDAVSGSIGLSHSALRRELEKEPCVLEQATLPELRGQPGA